MAAEIKEVKKTIASLKKQIREHRQELKKQSDSKIVAPPKKKISTPLKASEEIVVDIISKKNLGVFLKTFASSILNNQSFKKFLGIKKTKLSANDPNAGVLTPYTTGLEPVRDDATYNSIVNVNLSNLFPQIQDIINFNITPSHPSVNVCYEQLPSNWSTLSTPFIRVLFLTPNGYTNWDSAKPNGYNANGTLLEQDDEGKIDDLFPNTYDNASYKKGRIVNYTTPTGDVVPYSFKRSDSVSKAAVIDKNLDTIDQFAFSSTFSEGHQVIVTDFAMKIFNSINWVTAGYILIRCYNFEVRTSK
jgi:hypothetical protein